MNVSDLHRRSLQTSTALSKYYMPTAPTPRQVMTILNREDVGFVLFGLHGVGGWMNDPRATQDVDLVIASRHFKKAVVAISAAFPRLELINNTTVMRFVDPTTEKGVIDLVRPVQPLLQALFRNTRTMKVRGCEYRIPNLEMAVALKFAPMTSPHRSIADKYQDAHDFIMIVQSNPDIDLEKLAALGDLVYSKGGAEILEMVDKVRNGERLNF